MDGAKFNKGGQGTNQRFVRNRREENSLNYHQETNLPSQAGKVGSVKPQYSSAEHTKHLEIKPGMVAFNAKQDDAVRRETKQSYVKGKDVTFHAQHTQKGYRSNVKHDDRRRFNFPKEKPNNRHFKPNVRNQSKQKSDSIKANKNLTPNDETGSRKQTSKNESGSVMLKRNESMNANIPSVPKHLKPAVHVQPLQQVPEKTAVNSAVEESNFQTADSGSERCEDQVSNVGYANETITKKSTSHQTLSEQDSSAVVKNFPGGIEAPTGWNGSKEDMQKSVLMDPIFPGDTEAQSLTGLQGSTNGLGSYLSSSICSSFVPAFQKDMFEAQGNDVSVNQIMLEGSCLPPGQLQFAPDQSNNHSEKFLTEQHLEAFTNRKQDSRPCPAQDNVKEPSISRAQNSDVFQEPRDQLEEAACLQSVLDEKYGYRISVDSLFSTSFFTNPQAGAKTRKEMVETDTRDNHTMNNKKCSETLVLTNKIPRDHVLNEAQQCEVLEMKKQTSRLAHTSLSTSQDGNFDDRLVSPRHSTGINKAVLGSPPPVVRDLAPHRSLESECATALMKDVPFSLEGSTTRNYRNFSDKTEEHIGKERILPGKMSGFNRDENSHTVMTSEKQMASNIAQLKRTEILQEPRTKLSLANSADGQAESLVNPNYREIPKHSMRLQTDTFPSESKESASVRCPSTTEKTHQTKTELQTASSTSAKNVHEKQSDRTILNADVQDNHVHRGPFPQGPFIPNPFLGHSLLTHRQAIPSAFVYPSRVGMPGSRSGFTDVAQHTANTHGSHIFPPQGTTVCLNVGGRIFEILPSTFSAYPESLLCQIFTGATPAPISQRGHVFFDRDGYLFEIILAFARVGHLTLPPNINLPSLMSEAKFFGMYEYMFQKGQVSSGNVLQFQRTTRCTLQIDDSSKTSNTRVFVLQGDDKLKIESLHVSGSCCLYVDLYTPSGVKETSNFVIYTPDKPDLWKAYQFCAERQLVFHLERSHTDAIVAGCTKSSADIVYAQTFVFAGDEFLS